MRTILIAMIGLFGFVASAQYTLTGRVLDEEGKPMQGASIVERKSQKGVVSDANGQFAIPLKQLPAFIEISFIGYKTYSTVWDKAEEGQNTRNLQVKMSPYATELLSVTVSEEAYSSFFTHRTYSVLDFTFVDDYTLLLIKRNRAYKLLLIDEAQDSIAHAVLTSKAKGFIRDCLGHIYLGVGDSLEALNFANNQIHFIGALDLGFYVQRVKPCMAANGRNLYYQFYKFNNQYVEYYQTAIGAGESKRIRQMVDLEDAYSKHEYGENAKKATMSSPKTGFEMVAWFRDILSLPVYNPLFAVEEGALIFDHIQDSVIQYDQSGLVQNRFHVKHHKHKHFAKAILHDKYTNTFYVRYDKGGITSLLPLSKQDFSAGKQVEIKGHDFPVGLKVRAGVAYFLDYADDDYNRLKLHRQRL